MNDRRLEALIAYVRRARCKPGFEREEVEYRVEVADAIRGVMALAVSGQDWLAALAKACDTRYAGRYFDLVHPDSLRRFEQVAKASAIDIGRELSVFLDHPEDATGALRRFEQVVADADSSSGISVPPDSVLSLGSLFAFASAPKENPAIRPELMEELLWTLGYEWFNTAPSERYERLSKFIAELAATLNAAGISTRNMIEVESLLSIAANDLDFWADPAGPVAAEVKRSGPAETAYLSVCAIYRDEGRYLAEWIEFHKLVGVERFFLYNNFSEDEHRTVLEPYIEDGTVLLHEWPISGGQVPAYVDCLRWHRQDSRWIAFIDLDEFLFSPTGAKVSTLLREFEAYPGVVANWAMYGTSGHRRRPEGLVIENFVHRLDTPHNQHIKSIVDPSRVIRAAGPHFFRYPYLGPVDENHCPVGERPFTRSVSFERLRINHYHSKSEEELLAKQRLPTGGGLPRPSVAQVSASLERLRLEEEITGCVDEVLLPCVPKVRAALARRSSPQLSERSARESAQDRGSG